MRRTTWVLVTCCALSLAACKGGQGPLSLEILCSIDTGDPGADGTGDVPADTDVEGRDIPVLETDGEAPDTGDVAKPDGLVEIPPQDVPDAGPDIPPGTLGAACLEAKDCVSGYCIEGAEGFVCTQVCVEECPEGWYCRTYTIGSDTQSLCAPAGASLCKPCLSDQGCGDGVCLELAEGHFCGRDCSISTCPAGHECQLVTMSDGLTSKQCVPTNGTCSCRLADQGKERPCLVENTIGRCLGIESCDPATGWVGCTARTASIEECNGIDDDCNGVADDSPTTPSQACTNDVSGVGSCLGAWACRGESGWTCVGPIPAVETCNYLDDDCDGQTDQPFKDENGRYNTYEHCGQCGLTCEGRIPFAKTTTCDATKAAPTCIAVDCLDGYARISDILCAPMISSLCVPCQDDSACGTANDRCLTMGTMKFCGRDCAPGSVAGTDCPNGYQCQDLGEGVQQCVPLSGTCECTSANAGIVRLCQVENTLGICGGTEVCDPAQGWINCSARTPAPEICNGLDDDCNGLLDDTVVPPAEPCQKSWTDPVGGATYTCTAEWTCKDAGSGKEWVCDAATPAAEACNGRDDNCNGEIDEDFKAPGTNKYAVFDNCGACGVSCAGLVPHATMHCNALPIFPTCEVERCDEGWWKSSSLACSEFPPTLCLACATDRACQVPGDTCEILPGETSGHCLWDCSNGSLHPLVDAVRRTCPEGYTCEETDSEGQPFFKCVPASQTCDCLAANAGEARLCAIENTAGRCGGQETCDPVRGWVGCTALTPSAERCNDVDDDCNGLTDESWPSRGAVCTLGLGACQATGTFGCDGSGTGVTCNATPGLAQSESCNGQDDDCDGTTDEDFPDKNKPCVAGSGECTAAGVMVCRPDGLGVACDAVPAPAGIEACNDRDDDCDSAIDEDWPLKGRSCTRGTGECMTNGVYVCRTDGTDITCDAATPAGTAEACNGKDDDCDGSTDEDWPTRGDVCSVGLGTCQRNGTRICNAAGTSLVCSASPGFPAVESCNGADDDCDGNIDEDWEDKGKACQVGVGECLANGVNVCRTDGAGIACDAVAGTPGTEACNGLDDDCDGVVDDGFPNKGLVCARGLGECLRTGTYACTPDGTGTTCNAPVVAGTTETCNGLDDDCNGAIDEVWPDKGKACQVGVGECLRNGVFACSADGSGITCDVPPGDRVVELCNGKDDDCDGVIDNGFPNKGQACSRGLGECLRTGTFVCTADGTATTCTAPVVTGNATELCDDKDDDCNGVIDNGFPSKGTVCGRGLGQCIRTGTFVCAADGTHTSCNAPVVTGTTEMCNGLDDNCDGAIDETWPTKGKACQVGVGECLRNGVFTCNAGGTDIACDAAAGPAGTESCNGLDDDCDGVVDNGFANKGLVCTRGLGECLRTGTFACTADGTGTTCNAAVVGGTTETCNGKDDDCDGTVDDGYTNKGQACSLDLGECRRDGVFVCRADGAGTTCNAAVVTGNAVDRCDGLDDDCDGVVDDGYPNKGQACSLGLGECRRDGVFVCKADGSGTTCNAQVVTGNPLEKCDGLDDDCNGVVDNGFANKGQACTRGLGVCLRTGTYTCTADGTATTCSAPVIAGTTETCNGLDDDCDGSVDNGFANKGQACTRGLGECLRTGTFVCTGDGAGTTCNAPTVTGVTEECDGLDDDCNGVVDNGFANKGQVCTRGLGECRREGVYVCTADGAATTCNAAVIGGIAETCNGLDDDCDGSVDNGFPNKGQVCTRGLGECRREGVYVCLANGTATTCNAATVTGNATEFCDDKDDDCNGVIDNGFPNKGQVCTKGLGQCQAAGTYVCNVAKTATECNAVTGTPLGEACNYLDDDCDGSTDEDFLSGGRYVANTACGNCFTNCTQIWTPAASHANGVCNPTPLDPTCTYVCVAGYVDADTNPDNGCELFLDPLAVYVSTPVNGGNDFTGCGAWETPCATITYGIGRAVNGAKNKVLVSEGIYAENVTLTNGISILGGHNAATWLRDPDTNISVINGTTASPGKHVKAVVADGITSATEFSGFTIYGEANFYSVAGDSGGNSYAIWIRDSSSSLVVQDNIVYGGRASSGSPATPGVSGVNGGDGINGFNGLATGSDTCVGGAPRTGGPGGVSPCSANGGAGGTAVCPNNNGEQAPGTAGTAVAGGATAGAGGIGGNDAKVPNTPCNEPIYASGTTKFGGFGTSGTDGVDGSAGAGCALNTGLVVSGEWVGASGNGGVAGTTGGGGGGGGAGGGVDVNTGLNCNAGDTLGGGGGGGGGGGCGGSAGGTGRPGGGSFAIFVLRTGAVASAPVVVNNYVVRNQAGAGGDGGDGGIGGAGGKGGQGGNVAGLYYEFAAGTGGFGGSGGDGGDGGGGGGGCGGSSFGVYTYNLAALAPSYCSTSGNLFTSVGGAGSGGLGGQSNGHAGTSGLPGEAVNCRVQ